MRRLSQDERQSRLKALGYEMGRPGRGDYLSRGRKYKTFPIGVGGGPTNYFDTLTQVDDYIAQVEQIRLWQKDAAG